MKSSSTPLQNRVLPTGEIVSAPFRGHFTGNRGILPFDAAGWLGRSRWKHQHWIICTLHHPRGRYHGPQPARGWTPLFFTDEAVGLAAGHRPCAYCRRDAYDAWRTAWEQAFGHWPGHKEADKYLHKARVTRRREQVRHIADIGTLPTGAFVLLQGLPHLVRKDGICSWENGQYGPIVPRPTGPVSVLTPRPTISILHAGFRPEFADAASSDQNDV